ncbi:hypothetical protein O7632_17310 [Solwaraspora sp. WMMD406]|uniref:hypothetical protein n=1 Tax=Solwaraspora sp. WMMD406 TaxID=3016095 RepID=UPI002417C35E|nr:hypothetical protein [Solwaraspora sp. WMMD406]MDG4765845.1 hypothetical protein [Solwaraspora sp. WMMD406]
MKLKHINGNIDRCVEWMPTAELCRTCREGIAGDIRALPRLYEECGTVLGRASPGGLREKVSGGQLPGFTINGFAAEARTTILGTLARWSGLVAGERGITPPARRVAPLAAFLLIHFDWLAAHPAALELRAEVADAARLGRRVASPESVKRIVVGRCVSDGCDGLLTATVRGGRAGERTQVRCEADADHIWEEREWTGLRRQMRGTASATGSRWLTAADIARLWSTPIGTVYRLASEQGWHKVTRSGRAYYAENEVHQTFARRTARSV